MTGEENASHGIAPGEETLELLRDGEKGFEKLKELIESAQESLRLYYYTFASDGSGQAILDRLVDALDRGVTVSLIVDDFGSLETDDHFFDPITEHGGSFCEFQPNMVQGYLLRNHQKIAIADGWRGIIGSFNIADDHLRNDTKDPWRDIGVYVEGPAMERLAAYYDKLEDWTGGEERSHIRDLGRILDEAHETEGNVRWVMGGPARGESPYVQAIIDELNSGRDIDMIMAYFAPSRRVLAAVRKVARDARLRLIAARKTDVKLSRAAAWHTYRKLLRAGAEIYEYEPRLLHTKLLVSDKAVFIGSGNFDVRSLYVNLEVMLRVEREDFHKDICDMFCEELADSDRIDLQTLKAKANPLKRLWWRWAYYLMAIVDRFLSKYFAR